MSHINFSIIIPVFDYSIYIPTCLNSIINQNLDNIEIILINNSKNNIKKIIELYVNKFNNIKIINDDFEDFKVDLNLGVKNASGKYVTFVDSNDYVEIGIFEKLFNISEKNKLDIALCNLLFCNDLNNDLIKNTEHLLSFEKDFKNKVFGHNDVLNFISDINSMSFTKLYNKSFLVKNNIIFPNFMFGYEVFFYETFLKAEKIYIVDDYGYIRRINNKFIKNIDIQDYSDIFHAFSLIRDKFIEINIWEENKLKIYNHFIKSFSYYFNKTSNQNKEKFFSLFKEFFKDLFIKDNVLNELNEENTIQINKLSNSNNYIEFENKYKKIFSVVIPCYNVENYVEEAIDSIINQTFGFENNIEIILVDDGSTDKTMEICKKFADKYPNNIKFFSQKNQGQAVARNFGLKHVSGKYVNFLDADDTLMEDTFANVFEFFEKYYDEIDLVAFPMYFFGKKSGNHILNYKFKKNLLVTLHDYWNYPQLSASSAVFKRELFDKFQFDTNLISSEDSVMVNKILLEKMAYGVISSGGYNYRKRFDSSSTIDISSYNKKYYNDRLKGYFYELITYSKNKLGYVPKFIQYLVIYDIKWMFLNNNLYSLLEDDEIFEFKKNLRYIFDNIGDDVINFHFKDDPYKMKISMFKLKYGSFSIKNIGGTISLITDNNKILDSLNDHEIFIDIIEIKEDTLFISGLFDSYFEKEDFEIILSKNSDNFTEKFRPNYVSYSNRNDSDFLGSKLCFDFEIPLNLNESTTIKINIVYRSKEEIIITPSIKFFNYARMSEICNYSIWEDYFIKFKNNSFLISKYSYIKFIKEEISILIKILKVKGPYWTSAIAFHFVYLILFVFYRNKDIWLVMDRQERADDNAEHFFNYIHDINDGIKKYFVILKESPDYVRLSDSWKNILSFYSIKHRIMYLFADKMISSQADEIVVNPFLGKNVKFYSGLLTADKIFLQHGVAKDDMSSWLRKYDKNVKLLVTTADIEAKSFKDYKYNYADGVVQVLGLPRYDGLSNVSDKKQILIMPSWRRSLIHATEKQIQKSEYFLRFNSLINNKRLINLAKSCGYKIIFKPHPNTFEFIDLFDTNDFVIIDDKSKYQELFNNSSLLITDYSSLSFDFAYLKKPIIYYQYGNDYHFDNNFFVYETMGFGEVIKDEDDLINLIEDYLYDDCKIKSIYLKRSNSFYKFNDKHNSERVYYAIKKIK